MEQNCVINCGTIWKIETANTNGQHISLRSPFSFFLLCPKMDNSNRRNELSSENFALLTHIISLITIKTNTKLYLSQNSANFAYLHKIYLRFKICNNLYFIFPLDISRLSTMIWFSNAIQRICYGVYVCNVSSLHDISREKFY